MREVESLMRILRNGSFQCGINTAWNYGHILINPPGSRTNSAMNRLFHPPFASHALLTGLKASCR